MRNSTKLFLTVLVMLAFTTTALAADAIKVTLLGTGSPKPVFDRVSSGTLVEAGTQKLLFDCGPGITQRLFQAKVPYRAIDMLFITHLHSDHTTGIPNLYLTGALRLPYASRKDAFHIMGVTGTARMAKYVKEAYAADIQIRLDDEKIAPAAYEMDAKDITEGVVYEKDGVKVTAFDVYHGDYIKPSLGYRVDYKGHSVVISGDTKYSENLIKYSKGVDVLIHEVLIENSEVQKMDNPQGDAQRRIAAHHTLPEECAKIFNLTNPRQAVYTHIIRVSTHKDYPRPPIEGIMNRTRAAGYDGPLVVGEDLMTITVGDTVQVDKPKAN